MSKMNVSRYARIFQALCVALIPVILLSSPFIWFFGDKFTDATYGLNLANFSLLQRAYMVFLEAISNSLVVYGLVLLIRIARNFQKNEIFTTATVALFLKLRRIAGVWALYTMGYAVFFFSIFTTTIPVYFLITSLASVAIVYFFIFVFLSILAMLIVKATELQGDQDLTV